MANRFVFDFYPMLSEFDNIVQMMDCQDYDIDEIVAEWRHNYSDEELEAYYKTYLVKKSSDGQPNADDAKWLFIAVSKLYRRMSRLLRDLDPRKVRRIYVLEDEMLVVET